MGKTTGNLRVDLCWIFCISWVLFFPICQGTSHPNTLSRSVPSCLVISFLGTGKIQE